ncbi:hypothetical protein BJV78DRAFT_1159401, partial [Lactifluus subvellereus]
MCGGFDASDVLMMHPFMMMPAEEVREHLEGHEEIAGLAAAAECEGLEEKVALLPSTLSTMLLPPTSTAHDASSSLSSGAVPQGHMGSLAHRSYSQTPMVMEPRHPDSAQQQQQQQQQQAMVDDDRIGAHCTPT